jgi:hypothetical protein
MLAANRAFPFAYPAFDTPLTLLCRRGPRNLGSAKVFDEAHPWRDYSSIKGIETQGIG